MPIPSYHEMLPAPSPFGSLPTSLEVPKDNAPAQAADIRRVASAVLGVGEYLKDYVDAVPDELVVFSKGISVSNSEINGGGIQSTGNGSGYGIEAVGGATDGIGGRLIAGDTNGIGAEIIGKGTGKGASIAGGSNGPGAQISAGGGNNHGLDVYATGTGLGLRVMAGAAQLNGTQPAYNDDPGSNVVHSTNIPKAWAIVATDGIGGYSVGTDSINIDSCTLTSTYAEVTWKRAFSSANYAPSVTAEFTGAEFIVGAFARGSQTTTKVRIHFRDLIGAAVIDPTAKSFSFVVSVAGRH